MNDAGEARTRGACIWEGDRGSVDQGQGANDRVKSVNQVCPVYLSFDAEVWMSVILLVVEDCIEAGALG